MHCNFSLKSIDMTYWIVLELGDVICVTWCEKSVGVNSLKRTDWDSHSVSNMALSVSKSLIVQKESSWIIMCSNIWSFNSHAAGVQTVLQYPSIIADRFWVQKKLQPTGKEFVSNLLRQGRFDQSIKISDSLGTTKDNLYICSDSKKENSSWFWCTKYDTFP